MTTVDFITALFYEIDEQLGAIPKHPEAHLWPSEIVTLWANCAMTSFTLVGRSRDFTL